MATKLQNYFPMLRTRSQILSEIRADPALCEIYYNWPENWQEYFLDCCTGARGVKILYDTFFKEIMNPETHPERLNELLSLLLNRKVKVRKILPLESPRLADEASLLSMDIVVQMDDGSLANVEVQKIGYDFPGERSACYSADLLLRQYRQLRDQKKRAFQYRDIHPVYNIVFFEKSPVAFHEYPDVWIHRFSQRSDSGIEVEFLQRHCLIALDIFQENYQNKPVESQLDAWLSFLSTDNPEKIAELISRHPDFRALYEDIYEICRNTERVMGMYSKELSILDKNTVQFMIDEMREELNETKASLQNTEEKLQETANDLREVKAALEEKTDAFHRQNQLIQYLVEHVRNEDITRVLSDAAYAHELYQKFHKNFSEG